MLSLAKIDIHCPSRVFSNDVSTPSLLTEAIAMLRPGESARAFQYYFGGPKFQRYSQATLVAASGASSSSSPGSRSSSRIGIVILPCGHRRVR
jgi:hypothetical protein